MTQALEFAKTISKPAPSNRTSGCSPPEAFDDKPDEPSELERLEAQHRQDQDRVEVRIPNRVETCFTSVSGVIGDEKLFPEVVSGPRRKRDKRLVLLSLQPVLTVQGLRNFRKVPPKSRAEASCCEGRW